ncbi:hypothetical protein JQT66_14490 [Sulfitobacter mediterraneus]|uniref:Uncharacterized protein n=1 Tax=Sulfitobacter mediterraneus TaxID=83219 RepID=A0A061SM72_9RHOB|nr:hypothetical protein [Sulfitobacter mediterraneus]KAJ02806.1 hypothetical protein PM02_11980 [Sulfitobacter mediterraneus]MBM1311449.1 hypothetical protein [Sulfitobacter mediterraneus]MBM1315331.1 hypothetical protein [Sulfitobacter mediterraneus]MBM1323692.1 hypothetical protein [Sulfitobacter mediterraneus]MBM1327604.1 hypothetical protein [Sulfitobacter mediterraneus]
MPLFIAFVIAVIVVAIVARRNAGIRQCRWREDRAGSKGALVKYNCINCGAEAFRSTGKPDRCLSGQPKSGL